LVGPVGSTRFSDGTTTCALQIQQSENYDDQTKLLTKVAEGLHRLGLSRYANGSYPTLIMEIEHAAEALQRSYIKYILRRAKEKPT
jgi:hypothetical protein